MKKTTSFLVTCVTMLTLAAVPAGARTSFSPPPILDHLDSFYLEELFREGEESEDIILPPEDTPPYRAPIETSLEDSILLGLEQPLPFYPNTYYPFTVTDPGDLLPTPYVKGDVRHVPAYWSTAANPEFSQQHTVWQIGTSSGISEPEVYNLYVWYYRQIYTGSEWAIGPLERKAFTFTTRAYSTTTPQIPSLTWSSNFQKITLNWESAYLADGYEIAVREGTSGSYTVTDVGSVNSHVLKSLKTGTPYYIRIRSYYTPDGSQTRTYSEYSPIQKIIPSLQTPVLKKALQTSGGKARVTWKKVTGADGYQVFVRYARGEAYTRAKTTSAQTVLLDPKDSKNLYIRVRAYRILDGKKVFSDLTDPVRILMD